MGYKKAAMFMMKKSSKVIGLILIEGLIGCAEGFLRERKRTTYEDIKDNVGGLSNNITNVSMQILEDEIEQIEMLEDFDLL